MTKADLQEKLRLAHLHLWDECQAMDGASQHRSCDGKWSPLQHVHHISKGIAAFAKYLSYDKAIISTKFGITDRVSRSYEEVYDAYIAKLSEGAKSTPPFNPDDTASISINTERKKGEQILKEMMISLQDWSDQDLDHYICPHPNLGNMTAREMIYFTILHARHHHDAIQKIKIYL